MSPRTNAIVTIATLACAVASLAINVAATKQWKRIARGRAEVIAEQAEEITALREINYRLNREAQIAGLPSHGLLVAPRSETLDGRP